MSEFSSHLIAWQEMYGRHNLPWQNTTDPYLIYVSEVMLQQSQVATVMSYYSKFIERFPDIKTLASATQEEVLRYWSGLGYYSRARNLHQSAVIIVNTHQGIFPQDFSAMQLLPGIGRSTAAAVASLAFNQNQTILDGNVKRVLARHFLIEGWTGLSKVEKQLWLIAETMLPKKNIAIYTQGLMDLGATLCTRAKPKCGVCPLQVSCGAYQQKRVHELPTPKPHKIIPKKQTAMLILLHNNKVMLEKRPPTGIWGGLWCFPEIPVNENATVYCAQHLGMKVESLTNMLPLDHVFTHFQLRIYPRLLQTFTQISDCESERVWITFNDALISAIPTPVRKLLNLCQQQKY
ncbi:MAG: A/G-specific adenine glycosylase [Nitrosospira sp.]|nr:A/G-specific adenine glycosylase [Nitrosospira sp.]MBI0414282.1 A/G-specific adenine glycosylase [Nitrosospira sp.]MBI0417334.1 A/G-specific adenine glycosylase [Nitrosospira sp.]MBI0419433.1 A/G-specific adenine glycosylase [Nitrosospira sp.]